MNLITVASLAVAILCILFTASIYRELYKWSRQCQHAKIAVAYKRKVQIQAPLVEWLTWANQLEGDAASNGRVVYRNREVTVAILRPKLPPKRIRLIALLIRMRRARKQKVMT